MMKLTAFFLAMIATFMTANAFTLTAYDALPPKKWVAPSEEAPKQPDEVRETVRALYRVFQLGDKASGNDYPALSKPMGWSGEIGNGPKTAYDCLPPKPYKQEVSP